MLQLFDDPTIQSIGKPAKTRSALWSVAIHAVVFLFLLSLSLAPTFQELPVDLQVVHLAAPPPPPPPPPPAFVPAATTASTSRTSQTTSTQVTVRRPVRVFTPKLTAPVAIPQGVPEPEILGGLPPEFGVVGGVAGGVPGGVVGGTLAGVFGGTGTIPGPPAPPPPAPKAEKPAPPPPPQIVQVSAAVQEAKLLQMIQPEYPLSAKMARIQGAVRMRAIINPEGRITALEIFEGHPILRDAARAAVEKWLYRPTYLGERPVSVSTEIVVNFRLTT